MRRLARSGSPLQFLFVAVLTIASGCRQAPDAANDASAGADMQALRRSVRAARPDWSNYIEDMKAALGARAVAQWEGRPTRARIHEGRVEVHFRIEPPWDAYDIGIPVLLRDATGHVVRNVSFAPENDGGLYAFALTDSAVPWVELQYPQYHQTRIVFDAKGAWNAAGEKP